MQRQEAEPSGEPQGYQIQTRETLWGSVCLVATEAGMVVSTAMFGWSVVRDVNKKQQLHVATVGSSTYKFSW